MADWHFADDIFKCIFLREFLIILIQIALRWSDGLIDDKSALIQLMSWHLAGAKPLTESMTT